jgi:dTDP-4-dehydrorhamnose 3,5-epimerase
MGLNVRKTKLDGVLVVDPPTRFEDFRGEYVETYNRELYVEAGIDQDFIQDDISVSHRHVLRGLHGDRKTWKLVSCLYGRFYLVVVDWREDSPRRGQWEAFNLSDKNRLQVLIPPGCGNGHVVLSDQAIFHYKQTTTYDRESQFTLLWNDPSLDIWWPVREPMLSRRDEGRPD